MNILITGGTGFIGQALVKALLAKGHSITIVTRQSRPDVTFAQAVKFCQNLASFKNLNEFDAVINLAGEPIFARRWTAQQKQKLINSRLDITAKLAKLIQHSQTPPNTFISGSATGYYGDLTSAKFCAESTAYGNSFSAQLCKQWEAEALKAQSEETRVCLLRTGMVLAPEGGALLKMLPLYKLNLAGKLGTGEQYWAWISLKDHIKAVIFLLENAKCQGAYNLVAPNPVSNAEFNRRLAKALRRLAIFPTPEWLLKLALGERSQLLLENQPLIPAKLLEAGFEFTQPELDFQQILNQ